jgi:adenylate cyclase class IV
MQNNIEVELRALITKEDELTKLTKLCESNGSLIAEENRFLVDYSIYLAGGVRNRKKDIRIRSTNGQIELIVKLGSFADSSREESSVLITSDRLRPVLTTFALMGYKKGTAALRQISRYEVAGFEIAIQRVINFNKPDKVYSVFIEVEKMSDYKNKAKVEKDIANWMKQNDLKPINNEEWYSYVEDLNKSANGVFEYDNADWKLIENLKR